MLKHSRWCLLKRPSNLTEKQTVTISEVLKYNLETGTVEGFNNKAKLTMRKPYGFREYQTIELALYHQLGALPEPEFTHEFC